MRISLIKKDNIKDLIITDEIGNFWITDYDANGEKINLINVEKTEDEIKAYSNDNVFLLNGDKKIDSITLEYNNFYYIKNKNTRELMLIYVSQISDTSFKLYEIEKVVDGITIGSSPNCDIFYASPLLDQLHARVSLLALENSLNTNSKKLIIKDFNQRSNKSKNKFGIYINNKKVNKSWVLNNDDFIFIMGLKFSITYLDRRYILLINNPNEKVKLNPNKFVKLPVQDFNKAFTEYTDDSESSLDDKKIYFYKKPRFSNRIEDFELSIDDPPSKEKENQTPLLLTIGPMLTMSMTSLVMGYSAINNVYVNNASWSSAMPSLIICAVMFTSVFVWPFITKAYEKKKKAKDEKERQIKYGRYMTGRINAIKNEIVNQEKKLLYNYPSTFECSEIIKGKTSRFWERRITDEDFGRINLGYGNTDMKIDIKYSEKHFSMIEDNLKDIVNRVGTEPKKLKNVPIDFSIIENNTLGVIGNYNKSNKFMKDIILQMLALQSYDDLKLVILTNEAKEDSWKDFKIAPHMFSDEKDIRFFGSKNEEYKEICYQLEQIYLKRKEMLKEKNNNVISKPYYVIVTDSFKSIRSFEIIKRVLNDKVNYGFSIIILNDNIKKLPDGCTNFINITDAGSELYKDSEKNKKVLFIIDSNIYDYKNCVKVLANTYIELDKTKSGSIPDKLSFLEMYDINSIEQLNIYNKWKNNNPVLSLGAIVGVNAEGDNISIDLHEKYHGPHGLIAGMTGSGKSEFIITYILSMAINYHPDEAQFILIDYKGGGLAGAFEKNKDGIGLPHLVGTITNLDQAEIHRSFASLESELKRRQAAFNHARDISGESTVDIYKYQRMYREGRLDEPVSHLFIICDEFAELKTQEPEFMAQLISTARIGRSLGVHLILATQKPSGVVDPQIWSNTRFRVCLRVQETTDSSEVIKKPDAAFLKQTGRFYFQVGFDEIFELGQAAWAGAPYIPNKKARSKYDTSIKFINNLGYTYKNIETREKEVKDTSKGEELSNLVKYLSELADKNNIKTTPLWLPRIPDEIFVDNLVTKYNYEKEDYYINPIIGEYDDPNRQMQHLLTMPLTKNGNSLIFGMTGSGKENLITTLIYSASLYNTPEDLNFYILDFGSEALRMFKNHNLVGDILVNSDDEKIENLYKYIKDELETRKKIFSDFGGDYISYCKSNDKKLPQIVIIINNYEAYAELESDYEDTLIGLTRESTKYGIYFILTVSTPNGVRFKLGQNFNQIFVLNQNSEDDYINILGNVNKTYPSKGFGRGIIKEKEVFEFQTALVAPRDDINNFIREEIKVYNEKYPISAPNVKVLPEVVNYSEIKDYLKNDEITIGISKDNLIPLNVKYKKNFLNLITGEDLSLGSKFINSLIKELLFLKEDVIFLDVEEYEIEDSLKEQIVYVNDKFDDALTKFNEILENSESIKSTTIIINSPSSFVSKISLENKNKLTSLVDKLNSMKNTKIILLESIDKVKKLEIELWYKNYIGSGEGIWIGNGINDQFSLKVNPKSKHIKETIPDNFGFVIVRGKATLIKLLEDFNSNEEEN